MISDLMVLAVTIIITIIFMTEQAYAYGSTTNMSPIFSDITSWFLMNRKGKEKEVVLPVKLLSYQLKEAFGLASIRFASQQVR